jgi:SpoVK/Ycf46/Vps4 family AAA+-type ATPase
MVRKSKRQESCVFEFDRIEVWGPELKRLFKDVLPKRLKRIFEAEPPDDMEHAREILLAHMSIERGEVVERLRGWLKSRRVAAYYGARITEAGEEVARSELSLSRAPFERYFEAYVLKNEGAGAKAETVRVELDGADAVKGKGEVVDGLPGVIRETLDAWSYWLADPDFSPADEYVFVRILTS